MELGMDAYYSKDLTEAKEIKAMLVAKEIAKEEERKKREAEEERQRKALEEIELKRNKQLQEAKANLQTALLSSDISSLNKALQDAIQIGAQLPEVTQAREMLEALKNSQEVRSQLQAAIRVLEVKAESGISEMDLQPLIRALEVAEKVAKMKGTDMFSKHYYPFSYYANLKDRSKSLPMQRHSSLHSRSTSKPRQIWMWLSLQRIA